MRVLVAVLVVLMVILPCAPIGAQETSTVDHWSTKADCLAAEGARFYVPDIVNPKKESGVVVRGIPLGACVEMVLPDRLGGRGWVRVEAGRRFVFDQSSGKVLRLAECNNVVFNLVPFKTGQPVPEHQPQEVVVPLQQPASSFSSSSVNVNIDMRGVEPVREGIQPAYQSSHHNHHGWLIGGIILGGAAIGAGLAFHHGSSNSGNLNTGGAH